MNECEMLLLLVETGVVFPLFGTLVIEMTSNEVADEALWNYECKEK